MCESLRLVNLLLGQERFEDLLIRMPDGFYNLFPESKEWIWGEVLNAVNQAAPLSLVGPSVGLVLHPTTLLG